MYYWNTFFKNYVVIWYKVLLLAQDILYAQQTITSLHLFYWFREHKSKFEKEQKMDRCIQFHNIKDSTLKIYKLTEEYFEHNVYSDILSNFAFSRWRKICIVSIESPTSSCLLWWQKVGRKKSNLLLRICKNIIHGIIVKLRQKWKPMIYGYSRERILTVICYGSKMKRIIYVRAF